MAIDKAVDGTVLDGYFSDIADAIRAKGGSGTFTPAQMPQAIEDLPAGDPNLTALLAGSASGDIDVTLPEYSYAATLTFGDNRSYIKRNNYDVTGLTVRGARLWGNLDASTGGNGGLFFQGNAKNLKYIRLPDTEEVNIYKYNAYANAFQNLEEFTAPNLIGIAGSNRTFGGYSPTALKRFVCPNYTRNLISEMFYYCNQLALVDIKTGYVTPGTFNSCSALVALVMRATAVATLGATGAFTGTPIEAGTGYIYVPRDLIASYESATNWSTYAGQFRAIEDYTADGTIDGEFIMPT